MCASLAARSCSALARASIAIAPVIAHSIVDLGHSRFIDVVDDGDIYVRYGAVVIEVVVIPASALITIAKISKARS